MPFQDMAFEIAGEMNIPMPLAQTKINEALGQVYDDEEQQCWSFQLREDGWLTPGLQFASGSPWPGTVGQSRGFIFAKPFSDKIRGSHLAAAAWRHHRGRPFITEMQIRSPFYALYDIIHFDGEDTLTIDRPWMEPLPPRDFIFEDVDDWPDSLLDEDDIPQPYMIYQAYFPVAVKDFKRFFEIRDTTNSGILDYWSYSQKDLTDRDPQRVIFDLAAFAVFKDWDMRGAGTEFESATLGFPRYELWPHPLFTLPYSYSFLRRGPELVYPMDKLPAPLTEDMLKWKCREALYIYKESQKGDGVQRGSGADWHFLAQSAAAEYKAARNRIGKRDVALVDLFFTRFRPQRNWGCEPFGTIQGQLNLGGW